MSDVKIVIDKTDLDEVKETLEEMGIMYEVEGQK